jgi:hypothetical protein
MNGDGTNDNMYTYPIGDVLNYESWILNLGNLNFNKFWAFQHGGYSGIRDFADIHGDNKTHPVLSTSQNESHYVLRELSNGSYVQVAQLPLFSCNTLKVFSGDFNGDGRTDFLHLDKVGLVESPDY